ncbi:MAG: DUF4446 family protein [Actinobacteria bacterium]|nr:DUF4446 family protein [Actinomycetota bacterium]
MALSALGLAALALLFSVAGGAGRRGREPGGPIRLDDTLRGVLQGQANQIKRLEEAVRALNRIDKKQDAQIRGSIRNVALLRYDAFEDVGGRLSFSCALLDDDGSGVVLTSINGRQETRVYAKPITEGRSSHNLSVEEGEAVRQALSTPEETVRAR